MILQISCFGDILCNYKVAFSKNIFESLAAAILAGLFNQWYFILFSLSHHFVLQSDVKLNTTTVRSMRPQLQWLTGRPALGSVLVNRLWGSNGRYPNTNNTSRKVVTGKRFTFETFVNLKGHSFYTQVLLKRSIIYFLSNYFNPMRDQKYRNTINRYWCWYLIYSEEMHGCWWHGLLCRQVISGPGICNMEINSSTIENFKHVISRSVAKFTRL